VNDNVRNQAFSFKHSDLIITVHHSIFYFICSAVPPAVLFNSLLICV
jgi:hypothetical protein